jgi:pimeloyl-ACP methyl ester carboxylesterase
VPVAASRELARRRPDWKLEVFDGIGHVPQLEAPGRFVETAERWLGGAA